MKFLLISLTLLRQAFFILALSMTGAGLVQAAEPVNTLDKALFGYKANGVAIRGYDTVAYFTEGKPVEGSSQYTAEWMGATWQFASEENLNTFNENPEYYAPQYGGYCAYGVAQGYLVKIEPEQWSIVDDKLYLNFDADVQRKWRKDITGYIATADSAIDKLLKAD